MYLNTFSILKGSFGLLLGYHCLLTPSLVCTATSPLLISFLLWTSKCWSAPGSKSYLALLILHVLVPSTHQCSQMQSTTMTLFLNSTDLCILLLVFIVTPHLYVLPCVECHPEKHPLLRPFQMSQLI